MQMGNLTDLDHGHEEMSTPGLAERDRDDAVRYRPHARPAREPGHVESHFLKANSPDGRQALWIKHTLLVPRGRPEHAVAELWAVAFDQRGTEKLAIKQTFPLAEASWNEQPFTLRVGDAELTRETAHGRVARDGARIAWSLALARPAGASGAFRPFPYAAMYRGGFPRSKTLTPAPDLRVHGHVEVGEQRWELGGWRGAQGHNWGRSHAHAYAWTHANAWCEEGRTKVREGVWLEALSGRVRIAGGLTTPFLTVAGLAVDGELLRFDGPGALLARKVKVSTRSYGFTLTRPGATLHAEFHAEAPQFAGLRYVDPDGAELACLNAKIASGSLRLERGGKPLHLRTSQAALELGTRDPSHGIALLV